MPPKHRDVASAMHLVTAMILTAAALGGGVASAASFNLASGTSTTAQSLAANQTGSIASGATLSVSGATVAVTITGNNATLTNLGSLLQTGTGRAMRDNTGVTGLVINNGSISGCRRDPDECGQWQRNSEQLRLDDFTQRLRGRCAGGGLHGDHHRC